MNDYLPRQWSLRAWPAIIAGLFWLCVGAGGWSLLLGLLPGVLLLASGVAMLLWPGEDKITQYMGLGAVSSCPSSVTFVPAVCRCCMPVCRRRCRRRH